MRRSVIFHTAEVDEKLVQNEIVIQNKQQQSNDYSIQNLLATQHINNINNSDTCSSTSSQNNTRSHHHYNHNKLRHLESKDSGYEDDDDFTRSSSSSGSSEESERMDTAPSDSDSSRRGGERNTTTKTFLQNVSDFLSTKTSMPDLIPHHKTTSRSTAPVSGSPTFSTYLSPNTSNSNFYNNKQASQYSFGDDDIRNFQLMDPNSAQFKRRFESSVLSALKDPQIQYLLTLYSFVDERLLKNTLLKFLRGASLDTDTIQAAEDYLKKKDQRHGNHTNVNKHLDENVSKSDALFDFILQSRQQTKTAAPSIDLVVERTKQTEYNVQQRVERDLFLRQTCVANEQRSSTLKYVPGSVSGKVVSESSCEYCQKTFSNHQSLTRHLRTHEGKRSHKCSQCSRSFYDQASYMRHARSHNGDKKHKCEQCSMAFNKRSALEVHIRTHTGERPFVCKYCGKGFSISGNLHRHVLIHTGHRPYKCGKCPRAFNNPSHLARHINSFHT